MPSVYGLVKSVDLSTSCLTGFQCLDANRHLARKRGNQGLHARTLSIAHIDGVNELNNSDVHRGAVGFEVVDATAIATDLLSTWADAPRRPLGSRCLPRERSAHSLSAGVIF